MVVNNPLIRPAISWGGGIGRVPLNSNFFFGTSGQLVMNFELKTRLYIRAD